MRFYRRPPAAACHPQLAPLPMAQFSYLPSPYQPSKNASEVGPSRLAPPVLSQPETEAAGPAQGMSHTMPVEVATCFFLSSFRMIVRAIRAKLTCVMAVDLSRR